MSTALQWLSRRYSGPGQHTEHEMCINRYVFTTLIFAMLSFRGELSLSEFVPQYIVYGVVSLALHLHLLAHTTPVLLRRRLAMVIDMVFIGINLHLGDGYETCMTYPLFLWVIMGNGLRFGAALHAEAMVVAILCFVVVALTTPWWYNQPGFSIGTGIGLVVIPSYVLALVRRQEALVRKQAALVRSEEIARKKAEDDAEEKSRLYVKVADLNSMLEARANSDGLTGVANRRRFDELMIETWHTTAKTSKRMSMILMDIDHFKKLNDTYGHPAGDECLRRAAQVLVHAVQAIPATVARYGGEEFAIILPGMPLDQAIAVANQVRLAIAQALIVDRTGQRLCITASMGVSSWTTHSLPDPAVEIEAMIHDSDLGLYAAKDGGRNQVHPGPSSSVALIPAHAGA